MPETLKLLIEAWAKKNNCSCYELQTGYLTKEDLLQGSFNFKNAVVFVYAFKCNGIIANTNSLSLPLLTVQTLENYVQYEKICTVDDGGNIQHAESDFVFKIDNGARFKLSEGAAAMFVKIYSCSLHYVVLQQNCTC